jgi:cytochrome P450
MTMPHEFDIDRWAADFDILASAYVANPFAIWDSLRVACPIAHSSRRGSTWLLTRYDDVAAVAHDVTTFSSSDPSVVPSTRDAARTGTSTSYQLPPISADPPLHTFTRRILLPWFSHRRVAMMTPRTRGLCQRLAGAIVERGRGDASTEYARLIPVQVIAHVLGVADDVSDTFTTWVRDILDSGDDFERRNRGIESLGEYLVAELENRRTQGGDDLLSVLLEGVVDGHRIDEGMALGMAAMVLIAGVDTTWSAIGASLWHLAQHPEDRERLVANPAMMPFAVEELLRAYAPVTMARVVTEDTEFAGCQMRQGDKVLLNFPSANRDPKAFANPDAVILDRTENRHVAFGSGIHRCAGSNLARMELQVALEEWLRFIPVFRLDTDEDVTWTGGQVRGPRSVPIMVV